MGRQVRRSAGAQVGGFAGQWLGGSQVGRYLGRRVRRSMGGLEDRSLGVLHRLDAFNASYSALRPFVSTHTGFILGSHSVVRLIGGRSSGQRTSRANSRVGNSLVLPRGWRGGRDQVNALSNKHIVILDIIALRCDIAGTPPLLPTPGDYGHGIWSVRTLCLQTFGFHRLSPATTPSLTKAKVVPSPWVK